MVHPSFFPSAIAEAVGGHKMTFQGHYQPCDSGTNGFEAQLSPLVNILWALGITVRGPLQQLSFPGAQCLGYKISLRDPGTRWLSSLGWSRAQLELHLTTSQNYLSCPGAQSQEDRSGGAVASPGCSHQQYDSS